MAGGVWCGWPGEFPLLIKFLFPHEWLSVQVHPNDAEAQAIGQPRGKNECWYVLSAEPGAKLALGFVSEMTLREMEQAIQEGTLESRLRYVPVKAGDMVYVEAGTYACDRAGDGGAGDAAVQRYDVQAVRLWQAARAAFEGWAGGDEGADKGGAGCAGADGWVYAADQTPYFVVDRFGDGGRVEWAQGECRFWLRWERERRCAWRRQGRACASCGACGGSAGARGVDYVLEGAAKRR